MKINHKLVGSLLIVALLFLSLAPTSLSEENNEYPWWNEDWSYRQKIILPIDTSDEDAVYHPIDISFEFENTCWAEDETRHSVRVVYHQGSRFNELESQIYNLKHSSNDHIESCGLVFLIPEDADGEEEYYVYYDEEETSASDYPDRVSVKDSYFSYEPIRGVLTETWTYNIMQGENIIYSIAKKGTVNGGPVCQQVVKLKKGAKSLLPNLGEHTVSYGFFYWWYKDNEWHSERTVSKLVKSEISIDGNLMVKVGIASESEGGVLGSTVFHKYYYCPREDKSIYSSVKHEALGDLPSSDKVEATFMMVTSGVLKSSIVKELDYGHMPKYMHFYSDEERVKIHEFDPYPESQWEQIIGEEDDYDLGSSPWVSLDDGETGMAHGIVFDSTNVVSSGEDEKDGVELTLYQSNKPNLPGFDGRFSYLYPGRNAFEPGESADKNIPNDYVVEFKSLYYSTENGGYKDVEKQASLYQSLINYQPVEYEDEIDGDEETDEYNLTVYTHIPQSLLLKMIGAKVLLKNSYIHVELFYDDEIVGCKVSGKISLTENYRIDWKNVSFFRKAVFTHQKPRTYVVKVYLVNPLFGDEKEFIGFDVIDLKEDTDIHIKCKSQGKINLLFSDQNNKRIKDVETLVLKDDVVIHRANSDSNGMAVLGLPTGFYETYILKYYYKGFLINSEEIRLSLFNNLFPLKKNVDLDVYDFNVEVNDQLGETPDFDVEVSLTSEEMQEPTSITADRVENGVYYFDNLISADYKLNIKYDTIKVTESINIPGTDSLTITLNDLTLNLIDSWEFPFSSDELSISIKSFDFDEPVTIYAEKISEGKYKFSYLYPGDYSLFINYRSVVLQHDISIPIADNKIDLVFPVTFNITTSIFDTHGNPLHDAKVEIMRNGGQVSDVTMDNGTVLFAVPPGEYIIKVFYGDDIIAQRKVDVLNDKRLVIVTSKEPWQPYVVTAIGIVVLICAGILSYKRKQELLFLKLLAIILVFIALTAPWWSINGFLTEPHLETSTNLYIIPNNTITLTTNNDVIAGNIAIMEETFTFFVDIVLYLLISTVALISLNILLNRFTNHNKISFFTLFVALVLMITSIVVFCAVSSAFSQATVGGLFGSGELNVVIYGENTFEQIPCCWGLGIGFYMSIFSTFVILSLFLYAIKTKLSNGYKRLIKKLR